MSMLSRSGTMIRKKRRASSKKAPGVQVPTRTFGRASTPQPPLTPTGFTPEPVSPGPLSPSAMTLTPMTPSAPSLAVEIPLPMPKSAPASPSHLKASNNIFDFMDTNHYLPTKSVSCHMQMDLQANGTTKSKVGTLID